MQVSTKANSKLVFDDICLGCGLEMFDLGFKELTWVR